MQGTLNASHASGTLTSFFDSGAATSCVTTVSSCSAAYATNHPSATVANSAKASVYEAGAREVHMRISSPPIKHPDFYGIDTPERKSLLAATHTLEEMREYIGVDSLAFLSVDGVYRSAGYAARDNLRPQFTDHCFTGDYPTHLTDLVGESGKQQLSLLAEAG